MEKISEILSALRERLRSPLISSFVIAFIAANWKVWLGLFWYKTEMLQKTDYKSYVDFVVANAGWWSCLWGPLGVALVYTFGWPYLRNRVESFQAARDVDGEANKLEILKKGVMPIAEYIDRQKALTDYEVQLKKLIDAEREIGNTLRKANKDLMEEQMRNRNDFKAGLQANEELTRKNMLLKLKYDSATIDGIWYRELKPESAKTDKPLISKFEIKDGYMHDYDGDGASTGSKRIKYFEADFDGNQTQINFVVYDLITIQDRGIPRTMPLYREFILNMDNEGKNMEGIEHAFDKALKPIKLDIKLKKVK